MSQAIPASLTASYTSPTVSKVFSLALPAVPTSDSVDEKTAFVAAVRVNTSQMQDDINVFLTQKMEEDKAQEIAAAGGDLKKNAKEEEREEEMYGEEDVGED